MVDMQPTHENDNEVPYPPISLLMDNQGALQTATSDLTTKRSKHIDIRYRYVREKGPRRCHRDEIIPYQ